MLKHTANLSHSINCPRAKRFFFRRSVRKLPKPPPLPTRRMRNHRTTARPLPGVSRLIPNIDAWQRLVNAIGAGE